MSIKEQAHEIIDNLSDDADWENGLVRELYRQKKITLGMTDLEIVQHELSDSDITAIIQRMHSSSSRPDDMRNTKTYNPGNALTASWALVALSPLLFISLLLAPAAYLLSALGVFFGAKGMINKDKGAVIPLIIGLIELTLFIAIPVFGGGS